MKLQKNSGSFCIDSSCDHYRHNENLFSEVLRDRNIDRSHTFFAFRFIGF